MELVKVEVAVEVEDVLKDVLALGTVAVVVVDVSLNVPVVVELVGNGSCGNVERFVVVVVTELDIACIVDVPEIVEA